MTWIIRSPEQAGALPGAQLELFPSALPQSCDSSCSSRVTAVVEFPFLAKSVTSIRTVIGISYINLSIFEDLSGVCLQI